MVQVRVGADDYREFLSAAVAAGIGVDEWLVEAGRTTARATATDLEGIWQDVCAELDNPLLLDERVLTGLRTTRPRAIVEGILLLEAVDRHARDMVEIRLRDAIEKVLTRRLRHPVQIAITVAGRLAATVPPRPTPTPRPTPATATAMAAAVARRRPELTNAYADLIARPEVARRLAEVLVAAGALPPD